MAAPKSKPPKGMIHSPKVARATGFTTGQQTIKATKSNPVTSSRATAPGQQKQAAGVQSAKSFTPAATKSQSPLDQIGGFIQSRVDLMTGKTPSPISGAMKNPTPVIPYTQRNVQAIQKASRKP